MRLSGSFHVNWTLICVWTVKISRHTERSSSQYHDRYVGTCYEADSGAVAAAERRVAPRHHGNTEIIIPSRQQVRHSLRKYRRKTVKKKWFTRPPGLLLLWSAEEILSGLHYNFLFFLSNSTRLFSPTSYDTFFSWRTKRFVGFHHLNVNRVNDTWSVMSWQVKVYRCTAAHLYFIFSVNEDEGWRYSAASALFIVLLNLTQEDFLRYQF